MSLDTVLEFVAILHRLTLILFYNRAKAARAAGMYCIIVPITISLDVEIFGFSVYFQIDIE